MNGNFGGGTGIRLDPYLVEDWADFAEIRDGSYYALPMHMKGVNGSWKPPDPQDMPSEQSIGNLFYRVANGDAVPFCIPRNAFPSLHDTGDAAYPYIIFWGDFPTQDYKDAAASVSRKSKVTGILKPLSGEEVRITDDMIAADSLQISSSMLSSDVLIPGGVPSAELQVSLLLSDYDFSDVDLYGAELSLSYWLLISDNQWYEVPLGTYIAGITENNSEYGMVLTGYDRMSRMNGIKISEMGFEEETTYTPFEAVKMCADAADIQFCMTADDFSAFPNGNLRFRLYDLNGSVETARDLMMHMMQVIGCFAYVDRWCVLRIVPLAVRDPVREFQTQMRMHSSFSAAKYALQELSQTVTYYEGATSSIQNISFETLSVGVKAELPSNPLWQTLVPTGGNLRSAVALAVNHLCDALDPLRFKPCECGVYGDPALNLFDFVTYTGGKAQSGITSPITAYVWKYHGEHLLTANGAQAIAAVSKTQAEKAAYADKQGMIDTDTNLWRTANLKLIQTGYIGMQGFPYDTLEYYTNAEIGREA